MALYHSQTQRHVVRHILPQFQWTIIYLVRGHKLKFPNYIVFMSMNVIFTLANKTDLYEMLQDSEASHLGLQYLSKNLLDRKEDACWFILASLPLIFDCDLLDLTTTKK